ncbi:MAG TPA: transglycosylase domain-containing protein, partial [Hymenobacter sp.]
VAKNVFLWQGRSYVRKAAEAYFTVLIEFMWNKRRIMEMYLSVAEMGDCTFGVEAASQRYFGKSASRLNSAEAALLAGVLPNPLRFRASNPGPAARAKQLRVLRNMRRLGGITYVNTLINK